MDAAGPQTPLSDLETAALSQKYIGNRNPHILEFNLAVPMGCAVVAEYRQHTLDLNPGCVAGDQDHGLLPIGMPLGVGFTHENVNFTARISGAR